MVQAKNVGEGLESTLNGGKMISVATAGIDPTRTVGCRSRFMGAINVSLTSDPPDTVKRGKPPRQINDVSPVCGRANPVPHWNVRHVLPHLQLHLLSDSFLSIDISGPQPILSQSF